MSIQLTEGGLHRPRPEWVVSTIQQYAQMMDHTYNTEAGVAALPRAASFPSEVLDTDRWEVSLEEISPDQAARAHSLTAELYDQVLSSTELEQEVGKPELDITFQRREKGTPREIVRHIRFSGRLAVTVVKKISSEGTVVAFWPQINLGPRGDQILAQFGVQLSPDPKL